MSIFCLENRIMCLDDLDRFLGVEGKLWVAAILHAESVHVCTFSASDLPTYPRCRAATSRPDLPTYPLRLSRGCTLVHFGAVVADAPSPLSTPRSAAGQAQLRLGKPLCIALGQAPTLSGTQDE